MSCWKSLRGILAQVRWNIYILIYHPVAYARSHKEPFKRAIVVCETMNWIRLIIRYHWNTMFFSHMKIPSPYTVNSSAHSFVLNYHFFVYYSIYVINRIPHEYLERKSTVVKISRQSAHFIGYSNKCAGYPICSYGNFQHGSCITVRELKSYSLRDMKTNLKGSNKYLIWKWMKL